MGSSCVFSYITTSDNLEHPALIWNASGSLAEPARLGAVIVHGRTGHFAEKHLTTIADALATLGIRVITSNNRGAHESGAAREFFNDCVHDIEAAVAALRKLGCERIILLGHSYGGMKISFYGEHNGFENIHGLVLMSAIPYKKLSAETVAQAREMIARGEGDLLFSRREGTSVSLYHPLAVEKAVVEGFQGLTIDLLREATIPIYTFASKEEWSWFHELTTALLNPQAGIPDITGGIFEGLSDHTYTGRERAAAELIRGWIAKRFLP